MAGPPDPEADALDGLEEFLLGARPTLTRLEVAERAGVSLETATHLWHLLGFAQTDDEVPAFTEHDVRALRLAQDLIDFGVLDQERQDGLVRTWGRSFARLADWQVMLLSDLAREGDADAADELLQFATEVITRVEELQNVIWRRHLLSAGARLMVGRDSAAASVRAVCFVDIVGYTTRSKNLTERELVGWLEDFENTALSIVIAHSGRIIKNIGDELLVVADTPEHAASIALELTRRGADPDDPFPEVRAGVAYGDVVTRLGDVYGSVVNVAARLTSVARPGTVLIDQGMYEALSGQTDHDDEADADPGDAAAAEESPYRFKRLRRLSVKGYARLRAWSLRPAPA